jgi:biopolymer transport protein ExbD
MGAALSARSSSAWTVPANAEINVTPFVDVMLVLLIIFMVAIPVSTVSVKVDLPPAQAQKSPQSPPVIVSLTLSGRVFVGDRATDLAGLPAAVASAIGGADPTSQRVYVRADQGVSYGAFMGVMNRLRANGYGKVGLVGEDLER